MLETGGSPMKVYNIEETCSILKLKAPVLRKYSALLEDAGYTGIERNSKNARFYTDENIKILRELISYKDSGHMTLNDAANAIAERINGIDVMDVVTTQQPSNVAQQQDVKELKDFIEHLIDHIEKSEERHAQSTAVLLDEIQQVKIEMNVIKEIATSKEDRSDTPADKTMDNILKELQYTRKEMRELKEENARIDKEKVESEENKRGFFSRLFNK